MSSALQSLRPQLERVRRAWLTSPLPKFLHWWAGELRLLLPQRWRGLFGSSAVWFVLQHESLKPADADGDTDAWSIHRAGQPATLARWNDADDARMQQDALKSALLGTDREDVRLALCVPAAEALQRKLQLPLAARDNLRQVAGFEMDRQTPFRAAQVHYAARELTQPAPEGRFWAELVAMPRGKLDPLLARLAALGIAIDAVDLAVGSDRRGVNLLPPEQRPRHVSPRKRWNLALVALSLVLLVLILSQWLNNRRTALATMQAQVQAMHGEAQQVATLRQRLQDHAGAAGFLTDRKRNTVSTLDILQDLTKRLPPTAWLERLSIDDNGQLGFQGQSPQASALVDALKGSTLYSDATFQGTIQRDPATTKERFYMVAQLRKAPAKPAAATPAPTPGGMP